MCHSCKPHDASGGAPAADQQPQASSTAVEAEVPPGNEHHNLFVAHLNAGLCAATDTSSDTPVAIPENVQVGTAQMKQEVEYGCCRLRHNHVDAVDSSFHQVILIH